MSDHVILCNGDKVKVDDHVYLLPAWAPTIYSVARIMEFLPSEGVLSSSSKGKGKDQPPTRVRLAWFYRQSDVSDKPTADTRQLLAAIYSEVANVTQLQGKCYVSHRERISDLAGWKKRPDHFYFTRLFDPYIKREFEVLQASAVRNIPADVREVLCNRYEYVVAEKEIIPNLTGDLRLCDTCGEWCPHSESVQCDRCKKFYHMACVSPPLQIKPTKGYGWSCGSCSRPEDRASNASTRAGTPVGTKPRAAALRAAAAVPSTRPRGRPRKNQAQADVEESLEVRSFKGWPFRYFGMHTVAEDTLDEDDFIFPRTVTRVGPKYQAVVANNMRPEPIIHRESDRGGDNTIEILSLVDKMGDGDVSDLETIKKQLGTSDEQRSHVDWLTEVIKRLSDAFATGHNFATVNMKNVSRTEKWKSFETRYQDKPWTEDEKGAFEDGIVANGPELRSVREEVGTGKRSQAEVVRYYAHWKNSKLREENEQKRAGTFAPERAQSVLLSPVAGNGGGERTCAGCRTHSSPTWVKGPRGHSSPWLCNNCGPNWRKYGELNVRPLREEAQKGKGDKREGTPLTAGAPKRVKTQATSALTSAPLSRRNSPPISTGPQLLCVCCNKKGPLGQVLRCVQCKMQVHAGAAGAVVKLSEIETWLCELCNNEKTEEASLTTDCVLCPRIKRTHARGVIFPPPDSYLRICKPTEGQGWAHAVCAVFMPETTFTDDSRLRLVEGIASIPPLRWLKPCIMCQDTGGAVVGCSECSREFHVSCALKVGYRLGFELVPVKGRHRDDKSLVDFRGEQGTLTPVVRCKEHDRSSRQFYSMCDMNHDGQTALQIYCKNYKRAQTDTSYGLLRKARRLDSVLVTATSTPAASDKTLADEQQCGRCKSSFSPLFYPDNACGWLCHKCHFETGSRTVPDGTTNGHASLPISVT